ncbi:MAG: hypothetical protein GY868_05020 [Deltaproteobacteria bacterium]|nr:hypothetical protein [Deltaproteobacteria bacterium]
MTTQELDSFMEKNEHIEFAVNEEDAQVHFRNTRLDWYRNDEKRSTAVKFWKLEKMSSEDLVKEINRGLLVEGITRITGYFTKTNSWNPGKLGELKNRRRFSM